MRTNFHFRAVAIGAVLVTLGPAPAANAQDETRDAPVVSARSVVVRYAPAELDRDGNREALTARIEAAARAVCGRVDVKNFRARRLWRQCYDTAVADAMQQLERQRFAILRD